MINLDVIEQEILDLEKRDTTYATIERLAWLYVARDHLITPKNVGKLGGSEFLDACSGLQMDAVMDVINEHMECVKLLYPKEYSAIIGKINEIGAR